MKLVKYAEDEKRGVSIGFMVWWKEWNVEICIGVQRGDGLRNIEKKEAAGFGRLDVKNKRIFFNYYEIESLGD